MLREALVSMGNDVHLLDKWYRKDTNKVSTALSSGNSGPLEVRGSDVADCQLSYVIKNQLPAPKSPF